MLDPHIKPHLLSLKWWGLLDTRGGVDTFGVVVAERIAVGNIEVEVESKQVACCHGES